MTPRQWRERFDAFADRKTRAATTVALPRYLTEIEQPDERLVSIGSRWTAHLFDGPFYLDASCDARRPSCSLVFVQSADGNTGADDPAVLGAGDTDTHLIYEGLSRVAADAVLAGAETVRGGDLVFSVWHPELVALRRSLSLPRHPTQIVATRRGLDVDDTLLFNVPEIPVILLTGIAGADAMRRATDDRPWVTVIVMSDTARLAEGLSQLRTGGVERVSCVGGRHLGRQLLDAALVDDLYLTTSPRAGGEPHTPLHPAPLGGELIVRKRGTAHERGVVFEHIRRPSPVRDATAEAR